MSHSTGRRPCDLKQYSVLLLLVLLPWHVFAAPPTEEYKLKAALIYKLSKFVEWPDPAEAGTVHDFGICVLGEDFFGPALEVLETRETGGLPIRIKYVFQSEGIGTECQVVFVSKSKRAFIRSILKNLGGQPILTLGDTEGFAEQGGMIEFTRGGKHIGFKINLESAERSGLKFAAPLLELATIIGSQHRQTEP
jgi:hypothetical protein